MGNTSQNILNINNDVSDCKNAFEPNKLGNINSF